MDYPVQNSFRARCEKVIDGDTVELYVDLGFHAFRRDRFRILRINAPEMKGTTLQAAKAAKEHLAAMLVKEGEWPLKIITKKDTDSFGRWLAEIFTYQSDGIIIKEVSVGTIMVEAGHAKWFMCEAAK
jgi:micrococcal nuclease